MFWGQITKITFGTFWSLAEPWNTWNTWKKTDHPHPPPFLGPPTKIDDKLRLLFWAPDFGPYGPQMVRSWLLMNSKGVAIILISSTFSLPSFSMISANVPHPTPPHPTPKKENRALQKENRAQNHNLSLWSTSGPKYGPIHRALFWAQNGFWARLVKRGSWFSGPYFGA